MRTTVKKATVLGAISLLPVVPALLPINWEFVAPSLDPLAHMGGCAYTTIVFGVGLWLFRTDFEIHFPRFLAAGFVSAVIWLLVEPAQEFIAYHGPQLSDATNDLRGALLGMMIILALETAGSRLFGEKVKL